MLSIRASIRAYPSGHDSRPHFGVSVLVRALERLPPRDTGCSFVCRSGRIPLRARRARRFERRSARSGAGNSSSPRRRPRDDRWSRGPSAKACFACWKGFLLMIGTALVHKNRLFGLRVLRELVELPPITDGTTTSTERVITGHYHRTGSRRRGVAQLSE
jgi:hypothetical protein